MQVANDTAFCNAMGSSFPIKFALFFSLSLGAAAAVPLSLPRNLTPKSKATTSDLLSLLGSPHQAASVNSVVARQLRSCFKFLAPFNQTLPTRRALTSQLNTPVDYLIRSPPPPVLELARLAVDSGGDPGAIHRALDPTIITVMPLSLHSSFLFKHLVINCNYRVDWDWDLRVLAILLCQKSVWVNENDVNY